MSHTFEYHGRQLTAFEHLYNLTFLNERAVEIAVADDWWCREVEPRSTMFEPLWGLEVGNVLSHYGFVGSHWARRIVDRWEKPAFYQPRGTVENIDLFTLHGRFDWIVSISTIEHVGTDAPSEFTGVDALNHLRSLLAPEGRMLVTFPTGVSPWLDDAIRAGTTGAIRSATLVPVAETVWLQTAEPVVLPYAMGAGGYAYTIIGDGDVRRVAGSSWASAVWIGEFEA